MTHTAGRQLGWRDRLSPASTCVTRLAPNGPEPLAEVWPRGGASPRKPPSNHERAAPGPMASNDLINKRVDVERIWSRARPGSFGTLLTHG